MEWVGRPGIGGHELVQWEAPIEYLRFALIPLDWRAPAAPARSAVTRREYAPQGAHPGWKEMNFNDTYKYSILGSSQGRTCLHSFVPPDWAGCRGMRAGGPPSAQSFTGGPAHLHPKIEL
eukprot:scaffold137_cov398-Prasinococcus_capsulatus_cf.AAC.7